MPLLSLNELRQPPSIPEEPEESQSVFQVASTTSEQFLVGNHGLAIADFVGNLAELDTRYILSDGDWALHELIAYIFSVTGPASFALTSWGLTEKPLQEVLNLVQSGLALDPLIVLDYRVKLQSAKAYQLLLGSGLDIRLTQNHSKVVVVLNDRFAITVLTSANLTRNPRLEFYVISKSRAVATAIREQLTSIHASANPLT